MRRNNKRQKVVWRGQTPQLRSLLKLRVTNGRYPQLIATLTDGRDPFNFMVDFDPSKKTQGYAALQLPLNLAGLYNHAPNYQASFSLTVGGRRGVFINFWVPTDDDANREQANLPLVNDTALMKAEIGLIQQRLGSVPQYEPRCSEVADNCASQSPPDCTFSRTPLPFFLMTATPSRMQIVQDLNALLDKTFKSKLTKHDRRLFRGTAVEVFMDTTDEGILSSAHANFKVETTAR